MFPGVVDMHRSGGDRGDRFDGDQRLRGTEAENTPGAHAQEADLQLAVVDQQVVDHADLRARFVHDLPPADILVRIFDRQLRITQAV